MTLMSTQAKASLESYFSSFRKNIIGNQQTFKSPFGTKRILYADWTASGRAYLPIEKCIQDKVLPYLANTHTETTITGTLMSKAYQESKNIVKDHVNACGEDILVFCGSGMTSAVNKLQRILGMRIPEGISDYIEKTAVNNGFPWVSEDLRPVVFVTHMEHHSNHLSWLETIATVEIIKKNKNGNVDLEHFRTLLEKFRRRKNKIAAVTACSNVTGIQTPYHDIARLIHAHRGVFFVDLASSGPYCHINMHPAEPGTHLDAIYFSPHKFLGGPGTPGVLIFNKKLYRNLVPDHPGGGTVLFSNPWKVREYVQDVEQREDGGTPPLLQGIKAAMCIRLKEEMGIDNILEREEEILKKIFISMSMMKHIEVLEGEIQERLGVISFLVKGAHHNLIVKLLNDRFGIQTRGGCSCAGPYGHILLNVNEKRSQELLTTIRSGDLSSKPGWVRLSIHPTMTDAEIDFIMSAVEATASNFRAWSKDYSYNPHVNEFSFKETFDDEDAKFSGWFNPGRWTE